MDNSLVYMIGLPVEESFITEELTSFMNDGIPTLYCIELYHNPMVSKYDFLGENNFKMLEIETVTESDIAKDKVMCSLHNYEGSLRNVGAGNVFFPRRSAQKLISKLDKIRLKFPNTRIAICTFGSPFLYESLYSSAYRNPSPLTISLIDVQTFEDQNLTNFYECAIFNTNVLDHGIGRQYPADRSSYYFPIPKDLILNAEHTYTDDVHGDITLYTDVDRVINFSYNKVDTPMDIILSDADILAGLHQIKTSEIVVKPYNITFSANSVVISEMTVITGSDQIKTSEVLVKSDVALPSDLDVSGITSIHVSIAFGFDKDEDVLVFTPTEDITGSYDSSIGVLTLTSNRVVTISEWNSAMQTILYKNISDELFDIGVLIPSDIHTNKTFTQIVDETALLYAGRMPVVAYSGGIDSTLIIAAFIKNNIDFKFTVNSNAIKENPELYEYLKARYTSIQISDNDLSSALDVSDIVVTGEPGGLLFPQIKTDFIISSRSFSEIVSDGPDVNLDDYPYLLESVADDMLYNNVRSDFISRHMRYFSCDAARSEHLYDDYLLHIINKFPIEIKHYYQYKFFFKFIFNYYDTVMLNKSKFLGENLLVAFYNTDDFQRWALTNLDYNFEMYSDYKTEKMNMRDYSHSVIPVDTILTKTVYPSPVI